MQIKWYKRAINMLDAAIGYSSNMFGEVIALKFYQQVKHCAYLLESNPLLGKREPLLVHRKREYRSLVVHENYKLIYYVGNTYYLHRCAMELQ